jgi:hypothetical protein
VTGRVRSSLTGLAAASGHFRPRKTLTGRAGADRTRPVTSPVTDHSSIKQRYLLAPNSNFDDLGHFGKLTQRDTQPTKALDPIHNGSKQYSTPRAILVSGEHRKTFLSSPS